MHIKGNPKCPTCGKILDGVLCVDDPNIAPKSGDITACVYCGSLLEFIEGPALIKLSREKLVYLMNGVRKYLTCA